MKNRSASLSSIQICTILFVLALSVLAGCQHHGATARKQVLVMWSTDSTDRAYQEWNQLAEKEFRRQGIDAELHVHYGSFGSMTEKENQQEIAGIVHGLDKEGKRPDLILCFGDHQGWILQTITDSLTRTIPAVNFGRKDRNWLPYMDAMLENAVASYNLQPQNIVEIHDTFCLRRNLDLFDRIDNMNVPSGKPGHHLYITMLDRYGIWIDSIIINDLKAQMDCLDTLCYSNWMSRPGEAAGFKDLNSRGVITLMAYSMRDAGLNRIVPSVPATWALYHQKSPFQFVQAVHDNVTRTFTEGPNFSRYYTMTAEDFLVNDSCMGGYFSTAESMIEDAVTAGKRLMAGEMAREIGNSMHHPTCNINWDLMRDRGISLESMPQDAVLYNVEFSDRHPALYIAMCTAGILVSALLLLLSLFYSIRGIIRHSRNSRLIHQHALESIYDEKLLRFAMEASGAEMWTEEEGKGMLGRIETSDVFREKIRGILLGKEEGLSTLQFYGSIDGKEQHWYEMRLWTRLGSSGALERKGLIVNIDKVKETEAKEMEAHRLAINVRTREGFLSSMNHEIRTPLHAVVGCALELARTDVRFSEEELAEFSGYIESNAQALRKIIDDILLVTLMGKTNISAKCASCPVDGLLNPQKWNDADLLTRRRGNRISIQPGGNDVMALADVRMVSAVMDNLLINASMFSDMGSSIQVGYSIQDDSVDIWVQDEGIGIAPEYRTMIFDKFFKINSFKPGCGLGLFICRTYMELMGGSIRMEDAQPKGSRFIIRLRKASDKDKA